MQTEAHCDEHNLDFITENLCPACIKKYGRETARSAGSESRPSEWVDVLIARWEAELDTIPLDTTTGRESYDRLNNCIIELKEASNRNVSASTIGLQ